MNRNDTKEKIDSKIADSESLRQVEESSKITEEMSLEEQKALDWLGQEAEALGVGEIDLDRMKLAAIRAKINLDRKHRQFAHLQQLNSQLLFCTTELAHLNSALLSHPIRSQLVLDPQVQQVVMAKTVEYRHSLLRRPFTTDDEEKLLADVEYVNKIAEGYRMTKEWEELVELTNGLDADPLRAAEQVKEAEAELELLLQRRHYLLNKNKKS